MGSRGGSKTFTILKIFKHGYITYLNNLNSVNLKIFNISIHPGKKFLSKILATVHFKTASWTKAVSMFAWKITVTFCYRFSLVSLLLAIYSQHRRRDLTKKDQTMLLFHSNARLASLPPKSKSRHPCDHLLGSMWSHSTSPHS